MQLAIGVVATATAPPRISVFSLLALNNRIIMNESEWPSGLIDLRTPLKNDVGQRLDSAHICAQLVRKLYLAR